MTKLNRRDRHTMAVSALLVALAVVCRFLGNADFWPRNMGLVRSAIYLSLYVAYGFAIRNRIIQTQARRYLTAIDALIIFWFIARTLKFHIILNPDIVRHLWYLYYLPMLFIPLLAVFVALSLGKSEQYRLPRWTDLLYIPPAVLFLLTISNDHHQLVFTFPANAAVWKDNDGYGTVYYLAIAFMFLCAIAMLAIMYRKCRIPERNKWLCLPMLPIIALLVYMLLYYSQVPVLRFLLGDVTAVTCLMYVATLELCIQCGLIQSNGRYAELFKATTLAAQITDKDYAVCLSSDAAQPVSAEVLHEAEAAPVMLDGGTRLSCAPIHSGYIFWREDVSKLLSVLNELSGIQAELEDYHSLLDEENKQKKRRKKFEEQQRLYNAVQEKTAPHLALLSALSRELQVAPSSADAKRLLGKIAVIGAYLKRRSNLIILADSTGSIPSAELDLCLKETVSNLRMNGITCAVRFDFEDDMSAHAAGVLYDFYEAAVEVAFDTLTGFTAFIRHEAAMFRLSLILQCDTDMAQLAAQFPHASVTQEDGVWYCELSIPEGGARL